MKKLTLALLSLTIALASTAAFAQHHGRRGNNSNACQQQRQAKDQALRPLEQCINEWKRDRKPNEPAPTDNCSGELSNYTQAVSTYLTCNQQTPSQ